ncbi:TPA: hypothetical protein ACSIQO_003469 [Acinetobacter baumannii]|uniref:hypothetical protein n=1 Tax=Acinetobacter baumannii TaxID=470 RepID=UPI001F0996B2|nr:hypothetical protein [Acinetobacter baumannii]UMN97989.1 hypothetical protein L2Z30_08430 [Acinetobacter baumannii]
MDKYKVIAEKITYSLDGYIADHNNRNFGDADGWLRHVRNGWEEFIEAHPDSLNLHEYLQHHQAKVDELQTLYTQQGINMLKMQKRVDAVIIEIENMYLSGAIGFDTVKKLEQALKGDQYDEHRKKAEEAISKGASLTNHRIEL